VNRIGHENHQPDDEPNTEYGGGPAHDLVSPLDWLGAFVYMAAGLILAQWIVVTNSGMKYSQFLRNARAARSRN